MGSPPALRSEPMGRIDSLLVHDPPPAKGMTIFKQPEVIDSANLRKTSIVATLDSPLPKYQNIIWCSTFQMAWDKLKNDIIGEPIEVLGSENLANSLNAAEFSDKDIEDESYYATAGLLTDGIIEQIRNEMIQCFPSGPVPVFYGIVDLPFETIIAYSYLNAGIEFKYPFYINNYEFDFQDSNGMISEVASFCTLLDADSSDLVREQVDILYYRQAGRTGGTEFAVDLCKYTYPYQVVVANVSQQKNLDKTVADVEQKIFEFNQQPDYEQMRKLQPASDIRPADTLTVPDMLYELTHHFTELEGKAIGNQPWLDQGYCMGKAIQMTNFVLGRIGVLLRPDDQIVAPPLGQPQSRRFDFNRPFLIYIKKREPATSPFFVMWVDNAELMQEFLVESPE